MSKLRDVEHRIQLCFRAQVRATLRSVYQNGSNPAQFGRHWLSVMITPRNYWMISLNPDQFEITLEHGFKILGMGRAQKKRVQRMEIGDRVTFYVSGLQVFPATSTVDTTYFEDETPLWPSSSPDETFPWRVRLVPDVVLNKPRYLDARWIAPRMEYVRKWTPERWPLAFIGPLHLIPKKDFALIEDEMRRRKGPKKATLPAKNLVQCALDVVPSLEPRRHSVS